MKPTILVDMDGPLADFDRHFHEECAKKGIDLGCTPETQRHRFATDHIPNSMLRHHARRMVEMRPWFRELPVTPGAQEGLAALAEVADVWICTKPLEANLTCRDDKARWLVEHFGKEWERRLIVTPDKSMVMGDVLLDDAPKIDWIAGAAWLPVIFSMPWNGEGSNWDQYPHWTWADPIERLMANTPEVVMGMW